MEKNGVSAEVIRPVDYDIACGVDPDMRFVRSSVGGQVSSARAQALSPRPSCVASHATTL